MKHVNTKHAKKVDGAKQRQDYSKSVETNNKFFCDQCDYSCKTKKCLKKHKCESTTEEDTQKTFKCKECVEEFQSENELK